MTRPKEGEVEAQERLLQRYLDGEATEEERIQAEALLEAEPDLAGDLAEQREIGELLRSSLMAQAEAVDFEALWSKVDKELAWHEAGRERALAASAEQAGVEEPEPESLGAALKRLFSWPVLSALGAFALLLVMLPSMVTEPPEPMGPQAVGPVGVTEVVASAGANRFDGVEVVSVEAEGSASVMVFQGGDGASTFIWVSEPDSGSEGTSL